MLESDTLDERGQSFVLLALMFVGILAFVGLAIDIGMLFARRAAFSNAVDAAALAGVQEMHTAGGVSAALDRAHQFLNVNGWPVTEATTSTAEMTYTRVGVPEFTLTVTWPVDTYFMRILGFNTVDVGHSASATYASQIDVQTPTSYHFGAVQEASQFIIGRNGCTQGGDPTGPLSATSGGNPFFAMYAGSYYYRIRIPQTYTSTTIKVELFDPSAVNTVYANSAIAERVDGSTTAVSCPYTNIGSSCVMETGDAFSEVGYGNPVWILRADESWPAGCSNVPGGDTFNTDTRYTLYYLIENAEGTFERIDVSDYLAIAIDPAGDSSWYTPAGFGSIDVTAIPADSNGDRYLYLQVETESGYSMNVWDVWAGQPGHGLPTEVNARNLAIARNLDYARSVSFPVYAIGRLPLKPWTDNQIDLPLAPVPASMGGGAIYATVFDIDNGMSPDITFYYRDVGQAYYSQSLSTPCTGTTCSERWLMPQAIVDIPTVDDGVPFYGDHLIARLSPNRDAHTWQLSVTDGRPLLTR
jgi:Flp pilus assembly protein TadG